MVCFGTGLTIVGSLLVLSALGVASLVAWLTFVLLLLAVAVGFGIVRITFLKLN